MLGSKICTTTAQQLPPFLSPWPNPVLFLAPAPLALVSTHSWRDQLTVSHITSLSPEIPGAYPHLMKMRTQSGHNGAQLSRILPPCLPCYSLAIISPFPFWTSVPPATVPYVSLPWFATCKSSVGIALSPASASLAPLPLQVSFLNEACRDLKGCQ